MPRSVCARAVRAALKACLAIVLVVAVSGCTSPSQYTEEEVKKYDDDTTFRVTNTDDGFRVLVNYEEYQWWPSRYRSHQGCRDRLVTISEEYAEGLGRKIVEIDRLAIRVDSGRNILTGVTTCTATYKVKWLHPDERQPPRRNLL